jgi:hypothetical protein
MLRVTGSCRSASKQPMPPKEDRKNAPIQGRFSGTFFVFFRPEIARHRQSSGVFDGQ